MLDSSLFEQLLFYEFAPATDREIFKRWALKLAPSYKTEQVRNICFCQLRAPGLYFIVNIDSGRKFQV
jgi:hypothetical protein